MKNLRIFALLLLSAGALLTACENGDDWTPGEPVSKDCPLVYFQTQNLDLLGSSITLEPEEPTSLTFNVMRENTNGALNVPYTLYGDDVFQASEISFADGVNTTTLTIDFPTAQIGKTYSFSLALDPAYVSPYTKSPTSIDLELLRARWITLNENTTIDYYGQQLTGYCWYTDDILVSLFEEDPITYPVKVQVREDTIDANYPDGPNGLAGIYRMVNPYGENHPYNDPGDYRPYDVYVMLDATDPDSVILDYQEMGVNWGYGWMEFMDYGTYANSPSYHGWIEDGAIYFAVEDIVIFDDDGAYLGNPNGAFELIINQEIYDAAQ